jgi:hypothetical protein
VRVICVIWSGDPSVIWVLACHTLHNVPCRVLPRSISRPANHPDHNLKPFNPSQAPNRNHAPISPRLDYVTILQRARRAQLVGRVALAAAAAGAVYVVAAVARRVAAAGAA